MRISRWMSLLLVNLGAVGCQTEADQTETEAPVTQRELTEQETSGSVAERLERALRKLDRNEDLADAHAVLEAVLANRPATIEQRDEARLGLSRALEAQGDEEGAVAAVEAILAAHTEDGHYPARDAAEKRLRLLLTGKPEGETFRLPRDKPLPPVTSALAKLFEPDVDGKVLVDIYLFGSPGRARSDVFDVAEAKREENAFNLSASAWVGQSVSQSSSWTSLPQAIAEKRQDMAQADRSLLVFYFDLGDNRVPSRYDAYLPLPSAEIAAVLESGQGLVAMRRREGAKPTIVIAAPRGGQLATVEEVFAKLEELPSTPVKVPLGDGLLPGEIQGRVRAKFGVFRACYEELLSRDKEAQGKVEVELVINGNGGVERAAVSGDASLLDGKLQTCVLDGFQGLSFPAVGKETKVRYPLVMTP